MINELDFTRAPLLAVNQSELIGSDFLQHRCEGVGHVSAHSIQRLQPGGWASSLHHNNQMFS